MVWMFLGFNILILMTVWHFMVKKTLLDHTRDKLFDLRDELRRVHIESGWGIESAVYRNVREMLNAYLRYTEVYSIWRVVAFRVELSDSKHSSLRQMINQKIENGFKVENPEQEKYIQSIRLKARNALIENAVYGSGFLLLASVFVTPFLLVNSISQYCRKGFSVFFRAFSRDAIHLGRVMDKVWKRSITIVASKVIDQFTIDVATSDSKFKFG